MLFLSSLQSVGSKSEFTTGFYFMRKRLLLFTPHLSCFRCVPFSWIDSNAHLISFFHRFIPFSGGPRKCVGDQFALLEAIVALAVFVQHMDFKLVPDQKILMTTGATIHTTNVSADELIPCNRKIIDEFNTSLLPDF